MAARGFAHLSPPEAEHSMLELPTNRAEYVGVLQDLGDYPRRSPIGLRQPSGDEIEALARLAGRWRAVVLLEDERALRTAAGLFQRVFVLDPFFDTGALLYAAWHDPLIKDEHSRVLAEQTGLLVRAGPLLDGGIAVLAPDHLPGSWNPRPGWRKPRPTADARQRAAWAMRTSLVLLYWADRLDATVCVSREDVLAAAEVSLGATAASHWFRLAEPPRIDAAAALREAAAGELGEHWAAARRLTRRRSAARLLELGDLLTRIAERLDEGGGEPRPWRLALGQRRVPEPALLIRRVLNGQDPEREPRLPGKALRRRPLWIVPAADDLATAAGPEPRPARRP
jgi:hypothetical protein